MDATNAIIARHQSTRKTSPSKATWKATVFCLEAASGLDNERNKGVVRSLWAPQQYSPRDDNCHHSNVNCHEASNKLNHEAGGPLNGIPQAYWADSCPRSPVTNVGSTTNHAKKKSRTTTTKTALKNQAINIHHHDNRHHSSNDASLADCTSSAASDGKESTNKSSDYWSTGNYHLVILSKKRMGDVPHKSPGNKALVSPNSDTQKRNVSDAFAFASFLELEVRQHLPRWRQRGLIHHEFWWGTGKTQSVHPPAEISIAIVLI